MSLRERMRGSDADAGRRLSFLKWGVFGNPFPAASQTTEHPRMEDAADAEVERLFRDFEGDKKKSQVLLVVGTQGSGKTNLMNYYTDQFRDYYQDDERYYIIRYYPDPEPTFDAVIRRTFQYLDVEHFARMGVALREAESGMRNEAKEIARGHEVRKVLNSLERASGEGTEELTDCSRLAMEWFTGMRLLRAHRDRLGVSFRLDTKESQMQALRDVLYVSERLDLFRGIFLLMDELEKQDYSLAPTPALRFLLAIRALMDAMPRCLFLMLAMTPAARDRYFAMLPALAGRLQEEVTLGLIQDGSAAVELASFYLEHARGRALGETGSRRLRPQGKGTPFLDFEGEGERVFEELRRQSERRGIDGVLPRDFLHRLHEEWSRRTQPETASKT